MQKQADYDVVVIGAGAAGLMAALTAGQRGKRVLVLERAVQPGNKILISGGGRCNFTNTDAKPEQYFSANRSFCISALRRYTPEHFIALMQRHKIAFHEKKLGQLFCDESARAIVAMLLAECTAGGVAIRYGADIAGVGKTESFSVSLRTGEEVRSAALVVATGGLSIPKLGATGFAYDIARQFDIPVVTTRPALVPLTFAAPFFAGLAGVALPATVGCGALRFHENILFTHRGLSGPAILQISSVWREGAELVIDLLPHEAGAEGLLAEKRLRPNAAVKTVLGNLLPQRFAESWCAAYGLDGVVGQMRDQALQRVVHDLQHWQLTPSGTEGYAKAEVTAGGVDTRALSSQTMMVQTVPGLYFVGECVDVTGWLGGYNFQWAWASGWCAGMAV